MKLLEEHQMIRDMVREFAEAELAQVAASIDEKAEFPRSSIDKLAALNLMGLTLPEEFGGAGVDTLSCCLALEEIARVSGSTALIVAAHNTLVLPLLHRHAASEVQKSSLPELASGRKIGALAWTERAAGSEVEEVVSLARRNGDSYVLNGAKVFVANALAADLLILCVREDSEAQKPGLQLFAVDAGTPGLRLEAMDEQLGMRGTATGRVVFEDVQVESQRRLGSGEDGLELLLGALRFGQLGIAAVALGIAQGAYERSLRYAQERKQFGKSLDQFQAIQWKLADMSTEIHASRLLVHESAELAEAGSLSERQVAMTKLYCTETASRVCDHAIQIHGGYGYITEYHVERYYRDAKLCEIGWGTSEMQRIAIARELSREARQGMPLLQ